MKSKEAEYRELFLSEALENFEELNRLYIDLEKDHRNQRVINAIFRITHTLKGNSMGMGYQDIAELSHVLEDILGAIKSGTFKLDSEIFESLFRANDKLGALIKAVGSGEKVGYLGIKTKLEILIKNNQESLSESSEENPSNIEQANIESNIDSVETNNESEEDSAEITFSDFIQIPVKKLDELMNLAGQLIIERDRLNVRYTVEGNRNSDFESLYRITSNLQYSVMKVRMIQMGFLFQKFHRIIRDAATIEKKEVDLILKGTEVEIDRNILKIISESLIHLARNAVSHGIETPAQRLERKKPKVGQVTLNAINEKDNVIITILDDGNGIDAESIRRKIVRIGMVNPDIARNLTHNELIQFIFEPGFSNADKITELSGRGVGMDVVKKSVESIGGQVTVETEPTVGTTVRVSLPSSLALKSVLLFEIDDQEYAVPLVYTEAVASINKSEIHKIGNGLMTTFLNQTISLVFLKDLLDLPSLDHIHQKGSQQKTLITISEDTPLNMIVLSHAGKKTGIIVDKLLQQKEIIEKTLAKPLDGIKLLSGSTILGSGKVCPVLDVAAISELLYKSKNYKLQDVFKN